MTWCQSCGGSSQQTLYSGSHVNPHSGDLSLRCGGREEGSGYLQRAESSKMACIWCLAPPSEKTRAPTPVWLRIRRVAGRRRSPLLWPVSHCISFHKCTKFLTWNWKNAQCKYSVECSHKSECIIAAPPVWVMKPQDTSLEEGKPGYLHCHATASPEPEVTWLRNNLMITPEVTYMAYFSKHLFHLPNFILSLL